MTAVVYLGAAIIIPTLDMLTYGLRHEHISEHAYGLIGSLHRSFDPTCAKYNVAPPLARLAGILCKCSYPHELGAVVIEVI